MIKTREEQRKDITSNAKGECAFTLYNLKDFSGINEKIMQFSYVEIECGEEVGYHVHTGNAENYYIISGTGVYNDNGKEMPVGAGVITFTPSGQGHALKNTGEEKLCFIALVLKD